MTKADFIKKWDLRFQDNTTFEIDEADLREFKDDCAGLFGEPVVTAQLLDVSSASGELLILLSPDAPTSLASYVLVGAAAGQAALPAAAVLAGHELRLPASAAGQTLCLLDAASLPVPLCALRLPAALRRKAYDEASGASYSVSTDYLNTSLTLTVGGGVAPAVPVTLPPLTLAEVPALLQLACVQAPSGNLVYSLIVPGVRRPLRHGERVLLAALEEPAIPPNPTTGYPGQPAQAVWVVLSEPTYTDREARAAQLTRAAPTGSVIYLDNAERADDYGTATGGKFTIDATNCQRGVRVRFAVGVGGVKPDFINVPTNRPLKYVPGDIYVAGTEFNYSVLVCVDKIEVAIYS